MPALQTRLREWRLRSGWSQQALAVRAGVARQTVSGIEAGLCGPGIAVALRLAQALGCRVEELFALEEEVPEAMPVGRVGGTAVRVALGSIGGRTVARALGGLGALHWQTIAAHGLAGTAGTAGTVAVRRFGAAAPAVFLCGCDPALGLLAAHTARAAGHVETLWWQAGNAEALAQLQRGEVHGAAVHGDPNAQEGQAVHGSASSRHAASGCTPPAGAGPPRQPGESARHARTPRAAVGRDRDDRSAPRQTGLASPAPGLAGWRIGRWRMGWIVRPANPLGILGPEDLGRPGIRLANREPGSGARGLLDRLLAAAGVHPAGILGYGEHLPGHGPVADAVAEGRADAGIGPEVAAVDRGLHFIPVAIEVCDLWLPRHTLGDPAVAALLSTLASGAFRADLGAFGPYDTRETGERLV